MILRCPGKDNQSARHDRHTYLQEQHSTLRLRVLLARLVELTLSYIYVRAVEEFSADEGSDYYA